MNIFTMIEINKERYSFRDDYAGLLFVLKWTQTKKQYYGKNSFNLGNVMFDGVCFWGTDGCRLHYYYMKNTDIEPGVYTVIKRDDKSIILDRTDEGFQGFPQIARLIMFTAEYEWSLSISLSDNKYLKVNKLQEGKLRNRQQLVREYSRLIKKMQEDVTVDFQFFADLPAGAYEIYYYGDREMIGVCGEDKGAIIMPMII